MSIFRGAYACLLSQPVFIKRVAKIIQPVNLRIDYVNKLQNQVQGHVSF